MNIITEMRVEEIVHYIAEFAKRHDQHYVTFKDEPYEDVTAEWQDWTFLHPGYTQLHLGYFFVQNGDVVSDPMLVIYREDETITKVIITTCMGQPIETNIDDEYVTGIIRLIWQRHFVSRVMDQAEE